MTEQEATDKLEELVGSVGGCFRLMRIYRHAQESGNSFTLLMGPGVEAKFRSQAKAAGYSAESIEHYLDHVR